MVPDRSDLGDPVAAIPRPGPDCLILHYSGMPTGEAALKRLLAPASEVSAHYLIWEDGAIDQLVRESERAWNAGKAYWKGETD
jgi:N-acetylmuramoyl-L-alanine amidase